MDREDLLIKQTSASSVAKSVIIYDDSIGISQSKKQKCLAWLKMFILFVKLLLQDVLK